MFPENWREAKAICSEINKQKSAKSPEILQAILGQLKYFVTALIFCEYSQKLII